MAKKSHLTKEHINALQHRLEKDVTKLEKTIEVLDASDPFKNPEHVLDNAAVDTDVREQMGHDTVEAEVKALKKRLELVKKALRRIEKGTYGFDVKTGDPIPFERLNIVPEAQYTVETEKKLVK